MVSLSMLPSIFPDMVYSYLLISVQNKPDTKQRNDVQIASRRAEHFILRVRVIEISMLKMLKCYIIQAKEDNLRRS